MIPKKKTLWVMARGFEANERSKQFNAIPPSRMHQPGVKFIGVCSVLGGEGFDEIILDDIYAEVDKQQSQTMRAQIEEWVKYLRCRLYPRGTIRELVTVYEPPTAT